MSGILWFYFGWPDGAVWSNLLASAICAVLVWWRLHRQAAVHHAEAVVQAARHRVELLEQAQAHHKAVMALAERRHGELMSHADALHEGLKSHVTAVGSHVLTAAVPVPQKLLDDIKNAPKKPGPGGDPP